MNKKLISLAIAGAVATPFAAQAGSITVANQDITVSGGITGAYLYSSEKSGNHQDAFAVPDAILDFSSQAKTGGMGFTLGIGTLGENNLATGNELTVAGGGTSVAVQYGWVAVKPIDGLELDAGLLATNVGYEVSPSYGNANVLRGLVWDAQPTYYTGARATYTMSGISVYAEATKDPLGTNNPGGAVGASGDFSGIHGAISYYTRVDDKQIIDVIASGMAGPVNLGVNLDYIKWAKSQQVSGLDDSAIGIAFYGSIKPMDKVTLPVRIEYVSDGTSGIYGLTTTDASNNAVKNSAITFTVTPTYNFTDSTFVRAEFAYVTTDKKAAAGSFLDPGPYVDDKGAAKDSAWTIGVQGGVLF
jgi:hypothetical protein